MPLVAWSIVPERKIRKTPQIQYIQTHDLIAISASSGRLLLPDYVVSAKGLTAKSASDHYSPWTNDEFFWGKDADTLYTEDPEQLRDLRAKWLAALRSHPVRYLTHRTRVFLELLRIGSTEPGILPDSGIVENPWGFEFSENSLSRLLMASRRVAPWIFLPWLYLGVLIVACALVGSKSVPSEVRAFVVAANAGAWCFVAPHFFFAPGYEYRYLYFAYLLSIPALLVAIGGLGSSVRQRARVPRARASAAGTPDTR